MNTVLHIRGNFSSLISQFCGNRSFTNCCLVSQTLKFFAMSLLLQQCKKYIVASNLCNTSTATILQDTFIAGHVTLVNFLCNRTTNLQDKLKENSLA